MASLTETAYQTRRAINWTILAVIVYIILRLFWSFLVVFWMFLFPPREAPPTHAFGKLPKLAFPQPESSPSSQLTFTLQTISGNLPEQPAASRVYFMPKQAPNLLAISKTQEFAKRLDLDTTPIQETRTVYRFNDLQTPLRRLRYDIVSDNFILRYSYEQDIGVFSGVLNDAEKIKEEARLYLENLSLYLEDFKNGEQKVTYLKLVGNLLVPVPNISQLNAMRVDFFRGPINKLPLMTPVPTDGQVQILFSPSQDAKRKILEVIYTYWPVDQDTFATYSLRTVNQAWQELQSGSGYIAQYPTNGEMLATIRNVSMAYYDTYDPQTYLQPIYVFEGDHDFKAYVPAVSSEWIE